MAFHLSAMRLRSAGLATVAALSITLGSAVRASSPPSQAAGAAERPSALRYDAQTRGRVPIPTSERNLQTITAEPWVKVIDRATPLEGPAFDRDGNLYFCDVGSSRVLRITPSRRIAVALNQPGLVPGGLAFHRDGRLFIAAVGNFKAGSIDVFTAGESRAHPIVGTSAGYVPNDLVFDAQGGFYFSDFKGTATEPTGGVYYVSPDLKTVSPVLRRMAMANGIALSPDGKHLWVTEYAANRLLRLDIKSPGVLADGGSFVAYSFIGPAPDSMRADSEGNLYIAMNQQGRILVMNPAGIPIGQILLPGRQSGHNLLVTSMAFKPRTDEIYIVVNDGEGGAGASIFRARGFAKALLLFSHER